MKVRDYLFNEPKVRFFPFERTRELIMKTLKGIGCPSEVSDYGAVFFSHRGQEFSLDILTERIISIKRCDASFHSFKIKKGEELQYLKDVINHSNPMRALSVIYSIYDEITLLGVCCISEADFVQEIKYYADYILNCCFINRQYRIIF